MEECQGPAVGLIYMFRSRGLQALGALTVYV